jgi:hypothetical protein
LTDSGRQSQRSGTEICRKRLNEYEGAGKQAQKLESKGWKFGSAKELLGLSDQEQMYIELRLKLADGLK